MINVAVLGLGWWGSKLLRNMVDCPLAGKVIGVDTLEGCREEAASTFNVQTAGNPLALFEDKAINAVVIATPPATHYDLACRAFECGKDVLITKPPTQTVADLEDLVKRAAEHERIFMMDSTFVYSDPVRKMKEVLEGDLFKKVRFVQSLRYGNDLRMHQVDRLRNTMLANGVDVIEDLLFHDLAILKYIFPGVEFETRAVHRAHTLSRDLCDTAFVWLKANGFSVHIGLSWTLPERRREIVIADYEKQLIYDDLNPDEKLRLFWIEDKRDEIIECGNREPLSLVVQHFMDCVQNRTVPFTDGRYMLGVLRSFDSVMKFSD